ncbi:MAG: nicotinamide mononucleotide transporter family protein [Schleiferiaceae bacterium]|jgi:nicotinamide riboside transporter PnuC
MSTRLKQITESKWMDLLGVVTVVASSIALGFHKTEVAGLPIGILSTVGAAVSMMGTRWATKRKNWGNAVGVVTSVNSAIVDYFLGNKAAFLTYPVSLIGNALSFFVWSRKENRVPRTLDRYYFAVAAGAFVLAFGLNYIGFTGFLQHDLASEDVSKFVVTALITGLTFSGTLNMPRMYADTWIFWLVYNSLKLYQNILFGNVAFVAKYVFYLVNAVMAWRVWHFVRSTPTES